MNFYEALLLALALCVDSLAVSTTSALKSKLSYRRGVLLAFTFALFQGGFPLLGAMLGGAFEKLVASVDHWVAFGLLLLVGGKMIWDAFQGDDNDKALDLSRYWVICTLAVATSIDAFVVGIGFGLDTASRQDVSGLSSVGVCVVIAGVTFLAAMAGVVLGKRNIPIPEKWAGVLAGVVLIGLGVKTLLEHLCGW
ncbi:MAG: manganese efflux pump MntP family protein [Bacteroidales bacterium]|nr:manganese efflux pump MntP family protein [Bacteroidales bacterium]